MLGSLSSYTLGLIIQITTNFAPELMSKPITWILLKSLERWFGSQGFGWAVLDVRPNTLNGKWRMLKHHETCFWSKYKLKQTTISWEKNVGINER